MYCFHTGKVPEVGFSTGLDPFPTFLQILFYIIVACFGESFSSLVFQSSALLNSPIALVCNSAVAGPQPG